MRPQFITAATDGFCPCFTRTFTAAPGDKAVLHITGLGLYRAFLNGERIGDRYLTPGFNDYDAYVRSQEYELELREGENRLEIIVGDGWYKGRFGLTSATHIWGERYLLAAAVKLFHPDGTSETIETDEQWEARCSYVADNSIYDGEVWNPAGVKDTVYPCVIADVVYQVEEDHTPPIRERERRKAVLLLTPSGEQVLDFGQNFAGVVRFHADVPAGQEIWLQFGELLQDGCFCNTNLRSAKAEFRYISDGKPRTVEPYFTYFGFRYVKVTGISKVDPDNFEGVVLSTDLPETLEIETDSAKLNRLMQNALWGQRSNFMDIPTDCPQRDERLGWTADAQAFSGTAFYHMYCKEFYRKYMRDLRIDQERYFHGDIPAFSPSVKGASIPGGAAWADTATQLPWKVYRQYGDIELLRENYPMMRDYAETLLQKDRAEGGSHILRTGFTFGDWLALDGMTEQSMKGGTSDTYVRTACYYDSIRLTALAAAELGEKADAEKWDALAQEIRNAFLDEYLTPSGHLAITTQTGYLLALHLGLTRDREVMIHDLTAKLKHDRYRIACGFVGTQILLPVLFDCGLDDIAFRMLYNEEYPSWLYAVNMGATTIWERWNSVLESGELSGNGMNSLNHYAYGSVCEAIYSRIVGLRADQPGWKRVTLEPHFNWRMKWIRMRYDSPIGQFSVEWKTQNGGTVSVRATIPEAAVVEVHLPGMEPFTVGGGEYQWTVQAEKQLIFGPDTPLIDLLENEEASGVLRDELPGLYPTLCVSKELTPFSLQEILKMNPNFSGIDPEPVYQRLDALKLPKHSSI